MSKREQGRDSGIRAQRQTYRAADAGIETKIGCHSFSAPGITEYLRKGGKLDVAQQNRL